MNRSLSLFFAVVGVLLLCGISLSLSYRSVLGVIAFSTASVGFLGFGFALKARMRRHQDR